MWKHMSASSNARAEKKPESPRTMLLYRYTDNHITQALDKGSAPSHMHPVRRREEPARLLLHVQQQKVPEDLLAGW